MDWYYFLLRLTVCFILSFLIGLERELRGSNAGLRTSIIVCLGAFLFVSVSFDAYEDMMRMPAQVVSGVSFLGAGIIATSENKRSGLNTAATIWVVAAIGVLTGMELIFEACVGTFVIIFTNIFIRSVKKTITPDRYLEDDL